jgi:hypothetical protein
VGTTSAATGNNCDSFPSSFVCGGHNIPYSFLTNHFADYSRYTAMLFTISRRFMKLFHSTVFCIKSGNSSTTCPFKLTALGMTRDSDLFVERLKFCSKNKVPKPVTPSHLCFMVEIAEILADLCYSVNISLNIC